MGREEKPRLSRLVRFTISETEWTRLKFVAKARGLKGVGALLRIMSIDEALHRYATLAERITGTKP